ncbi:hypothetical protein [Corynebacterium sp.]|uniref:hypothetical protein n=1 Tax=Corynebacterium sp. TaxID=1720 RepID=UPI0026DBF178|nr:hypothetical protein [Corynebacterium sp.]MDO5032626.1 hypothetical protein [Corynebacterium sp.]
MRYHFAPLRRAAVASASVFTAAALFSPTANAASEAPTPIQPVSVSPSLTAKAEKYISIDNERFKLEPEAKGKLSKGETQRVESALAATNHLIESAEQNGTFEMEVSDDVITFYEGGESFTPYSTEFHEGRTGIEFHGTYVTVLMSKTLINGVGSTATVAGIWIPIPVLREAVATLGVAYGQCPGGIAMDFDAVSLIGHHFSGTAIPRSVRFQ